MEVGWDVAAVVQQLSMILQLYCWKVEQGEWIRFVFWALS